MSKIIKLFEKNTDMNEVRRLAQTLKDGGVIIYPTDTLYAFGCDAMNPKAVERLCKIKGVNPDKTNLSIICHDLSMVSEFVKIPNNMFQLIRKNIPGPFTFILETNSRLPKVFKNRKSVGVRVPDCTITRLLSQELGGPILTSSVKYDAFEPENSADPELIYEHYRFMVDAVIDAGVGKTQPSTIVDCTNDQATLIRQGLGSIDL